MDLIVFFFFFPLHPTLMAAGSISFFPELYIRTTFGGVGDGVVKICSWQEQAGSPARLFGCCCSSPEFISRVRKLEENPDVIMKQTREDILSKLCESVCMCVCVCE